jgi:hypothetical protein
MVSSPAERLFCDALIARHDSRAPAMRRIEVTPCGTVRRPFLGSNRVCHNWRRHSLLLATCQCRAAARVRQQGNVLLRQADRGHGCALASDVRSVRRPYARRDAPPSSARRYRRRCPSPSSSDGAGACACHGVRGLSACSWSCCWRARWNAVCVRHAPLRGRLLTRSLPAMRWLGWTVSAPQLRRSPRSRSADLAPPGTASGAEHGPSSACPGRTSGPRGKERAPRASAHALRHLPALARRGTRAQTRDLGEPSSTMRRSAGRRDASQREVRLPSRQAARTLAMCFDGESLRLGGGDAKCVAQLTPSSSTIGITQDSYTPTISVPSHAVPRNRVKVRHPL